MSSCSCLKSRVVFLLACIWCGTCLGSAQTSPTLTPANPLPAREGIAPISSASPRQNSLQVTFQDGLLSIAAENSTLVEVLRAVAAKTGARIDVPSGSGLERIAERTGPGSPESVLKHLLHGSGYGFVILTSPRAPHVLESVRLYPGGIAAPAEAPVEVASTDAAVEDAGPQVYGAGFALSPEEQQEQEAQEALERAAREAQNAQAASGEKISDEELVRMQKERLKQRQAQMQQSQAAQDH